MFKYKLVEGGYSLKVANPEEAAFRLLNDPEFIEHVAILVETAINSRSLNNIHEDGDFGFFEFCNLLDFKLVDRTQISRFFNVRNLGNEINFDFHFEAVVKPKPDTTYPVMKYLPKDGKVRLYYSAKVIIVDDE